MAIIKMDFGELNSGGPNIPEEIDASLVLSGWSLNASGQLVLSKTAKGTYYFYTSGKVDLTEYDTILISVSNYQQNNSTSKPCYMGISDQVITSSSAMTRSVQVIGGAISLDVSDLQGEYYIGVSNVLTWSSSGYSKITIDYFHLVPRVTDMVLSSV